MDGRKRPREDSSCNSADNFKTPEKRVSVVPRQDGSSEQWDVDLRNWDIEKTCRYLRHEGLEEWESTFKGEVSLFTEVSTVSVNMVTRLTW